MLLSLVFFISPYLVPSRFSTQLLWPFPIFVVSKKIISAFFLCGCGRGYRTGITSIPSTHLTLGNGGSSCYKCLLRAYNPKGERQFTPSSCVVGGRVSGLAPSRKKKQSLPFLPVIDHTVLRYILGAYQHRDAIACVPSFFHTQTINRGSESSPRERTGIGASLC